MGLNSPTSSGGGEVPVKATRDDLINKTDDAKFATALSLANSQYGDYTQINPNDSARATDLILTNRQIRARVVQITASGAGTPGSQIMLGGLTGEVDTDFDAGANANEFAANITNWANAHGGSIPVGGLITNGGEGNMQVTIPCVPGSDAQDDLSFGSDDGALVFSDIETGGDAALLNLPLSDLAAAIDAILNP